MPRPVWEPGPLTADKFASMAEQFHHAAEDNMRLHGKVMPFCFLFGPESEGLAAVSVQELQEHLDVLHGIAHDSGAVAAILVRQAAATEALPMDLLNSPAAGLANYLPKTRILILTESRWPMGGMRQMRITQVRHTEFGGMTYQRDPEDPDRVRGGSDDLARILPHVPAAPKS